MLFTSNCWSRADEELLWMGSCWLGAEPLLPSSSSTRVPTTPNNSELTSLDSVYILPPSFFSSAFGSHGIYINVRVR